MTDVHPAQPDRALESALAFWRDAGLEVCVEDAPVDRLHAPQPVRRPANIAEVAPSPLAPAGQDIGAAIAEAHRLSAAAHSIEELARAVAAFEGCELRRLGAKQTVFWRGRTDAPIVIVGEGPGADEDAQGAPFVGKAGKLLDAMLKAVDLQDDVFITNTVFWRPPGNRTPSTTEQMTCAPFVERAIALVRPKLLVFVGGASAKFMLKTEDGILSLRGQWRDWRPSEGGETYPALPMLHPAFLLRQPQAKARGWQDLLSLSARLAAEG